MEKSTFPHCLMILSPQNHLSKSDVYAAEAATETTLSHLTLIAPKTLNFSNFSDRQI